jgi:hypothetical protein
MKTAFAAFLLLGSPFASLGSPEFRLADYLLATEPEAALRKCFEDVAKAGGGSVTIPPGDYPLKWGVPMPLCSNTTVSAYGARFHLPEELGDKARIVVFEGTDLQNFTWLGGHFEGHCFDHRRPGNTWTPNTSTRILVLKTSPKGKTAHLLFRDLSSDRVAGAVVNVEGASKPGSESEVVAYATDVSVENCSFKDSGKFMWDYGLLWQILVWPEDYQPSDVAMASLYFRNDLIHPTKGMSDGDDRVLIENGTHVFPVATATNNESDAAKQGICFFGDRLPENIVRGKRYYVVESTGSYFKVSESVGGDPIRFKGKGGAGVKVIVDLHSAYFGLYAPLGAAPGKGCVDVVAAQQVKVTGSRLSALGDTMHIQRCKDIVFANNHITGSRMGAFFLAEYCKNATITGNIIDGTNGSRVISVEKSSENVTIVGNTFRNGGRGSWINQPKNLIIQGNIFVNNTTKCEPDAWRGRKTFKTGTWESYPEMYFTLHEPHGRYGPVILKDNLFVLGESCSSEVVTFAPNGFSVQMSGNVFQGKNGEIVIDPACVDFVVKDNAGANVVRKGSRSQSGNW